MMSTHSMSASVVISANVTPDLLEVDDDKLKTVDSPLTNELVCSAVNMYPVDLSPYRYEEM